MFNLLSDKVSPLSMSADGFLALEKIFDLIEILSSQDRCFWPEMSGRDDLKSVGDNSLIEPEFLSSSIETTGLWGR